MNYLIPLPLVMFYTGCFLIAGSWKSEFNGYPLAAVLVFTLTAVLRHTAALYVLYLRRGRIPAC